MDLLERFVTWSGGVLRRLFTFSGCVGAILLILVGSTLLAFTFGWVFGKPLQTLRDKVGGWEWTMPSIPCPAFVCGSNGSGGSGGGSGSGGGGTSEGPKGLIKADGTWWVLDKADDGTTCARSVKIIVDVQGPTVKFPVCWQMVIDGPGNVKVTAAAGPDYGVSDTRKTGLSFWPAGNGLISVNGGAPVALPGEAQVYNDSTSQTTMEIKSEGTVTIPLGERP